MAPSAIQLTGRGPQARELNFRHTGIDRELTAGGWEQFLASLTAYTEHGQRHPSRA